MSFFRSSSAPEPTPALPSAPAFENNAGPSIESDALMAFKANLTAFSDQLNDVNTACWIRCMSKKSQPELSVGESICVDRLVNIFTQF
jgi:hypothetical protein